MKLTRTRPPQRLFCLSILLFPIIAIIAATLPQSDLKYQYRGDRHEGVDKGFPVSDKAELISAVVSYSEKLNEIPAKYNLKFYLNQTEPVFVRVRELDNQHNYWMDRLRPQKAWRPGFDNEFQWSTDVVAKPKNIKLDDLGVVAQLGSDQPSVDMRVAPVILFGARYPDRITGYSFTYKISRKADVTCSFSKDVGNSPLLATQTSEVPGQRPRTCDWNVANLSEGWYKLTITIIYSNNGLKVDQFVRFYHRPSIR